MENFVNPEPFRRRFLQGEITKKHLLDVLGHVVNIVDATSVLEMESRLIVAQDVFLLQLGYGFSAMSSSAWGEFLHNNQAPQQFRSDLPPESRTRILDRVLRECEHCRDHPEKAYLANLWKSTLRALDLVDPFQLPGPRGAEKDERSSRTSNAQPSESSQTRFCQEAWRLFEMAQFLELSPIDLWDFTVQDIRTLLGWLDALPDNIQRLVWMRAFDLG